MASKWVFPGGRIDRSDFTAAATGELSGEVARRLEGELPARRARALALTAVRETFEETGLILGRPAPRASVAGPWREYRQGGRPAGSVGSVLCRARHYARRAGPAGSTPGFSWPRLRPC